MTLPTRRRCILVLLGVVLSVSGCPGKRYAPSPNDNICTLFREQGGWFKAAHKSSRQWGVPIPVMMAIMHQESKYDPTARPPRTTCCCILPGPRPSSAFGYAQALDETWERYKRDSDNRGADRDCFADAIDFVGWYCHLSRVRCGIAADDAYNLYLAYHEGQTGYLRKTHQNKQWLKNVAGTVQGRAAKYSRQIAACEKELLGSLGCCLWPF